MRTSCLIIAVMLAIALLSANNVAGGAGNDASASDGAVATTQVQAAYGRLPLHFEANQGQTDAQVRFLARGPGYSVFLTPTEAVLVFARAESDAAAEELVTVDQRAAQRMMSVLRMTFPGADPAQVVGIEELSGKVNYFLGNDPTQWRTNVPTYARVQYRELYPGIDLVWYGSQRYLEYDFIVQPGADPSRIAVDFQGADKVEVDAQGDLVLHTAAGVIHQRRPIIYQELNDGRREIAGGYVRKSTKSVGFEVAAYDRRRPLVIDPVLAYSTYVGAGGGAGTTIAVDAAGNTYVTGWTYFREFPTTPGALQTTPGWNVPDAFVTKVNPSGSGLAYSTYLGGYNFDRAFGIAVDATGHAYVAGYTDSWDFPTTPGAFEPVGSGAFVAKLDPNGSGLIYSTYLNGGGSFNQPQIRIAIDAAGNAYVTGLTWSSAFPTTPGAFQSVKKGFCDAFVTKLNPTGSGLVYSTYLGGAGGGDPSGYCMELGLGVAVDMAGNAYLVGITNSTDFPTTPGAFQTTAIGYTSVFVTKLNADGSGLAYSTYLGGAGYHSGSIAVDLLGNAYVTGNTWSNVFPTTPGAFQPIHAGSYDAFVTKLSPTGHGLVYSTYLGGTGADWGDSLAVDVTGNAYVTGGTYSTNFATTAGTIQPASGGLLDAFAVKLNRDGSGLVYSTYLGGASYDQGWGIAVDLTGSAYLTGSADSLNFPRTPGTFQTVGSGVFVAKIAEIALHASLPPLPPLPPLPLLPSPLGR